MSVLLIIVFVVLGLFVGSFLNVCIDRLPHGQSIVAPPSHCPSCNQKLGVLDLIPVISYLFLRGNCRYCKAHIPFRLPLVEGITAVLFGFLYWKLGLTLDLVILLVYTCLLMVIFFIDQENQLVLDKVTYPGMVFALVFSYFWPNTRTFTLFWPGTSVFGALLGGAVGLVTLLLIFIISRGGMGFGDVKMAALIGLMVGFPLVIETLLISWLVGGVVAVILLLTRAKGSKDRIPSATFLAVAAMVTMLWGQNIYHWWLPQL